MQKHMTENHIENEVELEQENSTNVRKIVLLKKRTLTWPCLVISEADEILKIKSFKDDKILEVKRSDVQPFNIENIGETKNHKLKKGMQKQQPF